MAKENTLESPEIGDRVEFLNRMEVLAKPNIEFTPEKTQQEEKELSELEYARNLFNLEIF